MKISSYPKVFNIFGKENTGLTKKIIDINVEKIMRCALFDEHMFARCTKDKRVPYYTRIIFSFNGIKLINMMHTTLKMNLYSSLKITHTLIVRKLQTILLRMRTVSLIT